MLHFRVVLLICSHLEKNQGEVRLTLSCPRFRLDFKTVCTDKGPRRLAGEANIAFLPVERCGVRTGLRLRVVAKPEGETARFLARQSKMIKNAVPN